MKAVVIVNDRLTVDLVTLAFRFRWPDINVVTTASGKRGAELVELESPDLVIIGFDVVDVDGMAVLEEIRRFSDIPIVILSDRTETTDIIKALESGADDYLNKPYDPGILLARVHSVLRRTQHYKSKNASEHLTYGGLIVDTGSHEVFYMGKMVHLTSTEWRLFYYLIRNPGRTVPHEELKEKIWGDEYYGGTDAIRTFIYRLRSKLSETGFSQKIIAGEHGIGYRFVKPQTVPN
jgi:DNA-binding response OmpR family regulator